MEHTEGELHTACGVRTGVQRVPHSVLAALAIGLLAGQSGCTSQKEPLACARGGKSAVMHPDRIHAAAQMQDLRALIAGNTAFAIDLYQSMRREPSLQGRNIFGSPYSVSCALAVVHAGAVGSTAREIADILHFTLPAERLEDTFRMLAAELRNRSELADGAPGKGCSLNIVNSTWMSQELPVRPEFLRSLEITNGELERVDFKNRPEAARLRINRWVHDQTNGRVEDVLPKRAVRSATQWILIDTVDFRAAWLQPFDTRDTSAQSFHRLDGSAVRVDMMSKRDTLRVGGGEGYRAVEIPYASGKLAFYVILPDAGRFDEVESALSPAELAALVEGMQKRRVLLQLPKHVYNGEPLRLKSILSRMGMTRVFDPERANFSRMVDPQQAKLAIDEIHHKALLRLDEQGAEAAGATGIVSGATTFASTTAFTIDRPFLFFVLDIPTGTMLFGGRIVDPTGA